MQLDKDELIAGVSVRAVRDLLKNQDGRMFSNEWVQEKLKVSTAAARRVTKELDKRGLLTHAEIVEHGRSVRSENWFETTTEGNAFGLASLLPRMSRAKADQLLAAVVQRAREANTSDAFAHYFAELRVFGSYLSDVADLGDLDLVVALTPRLEGPAYTALCLKIAEKRSGLSFFQRLTYAEIKLLSHLKARSGRISLHSMDDLDHLDPRPGSRIVFQRAI